MDKGKLGNGSRIHQHFQRLRLRRMASFRRSTSSLRAYSRSASSDTAVSMRLTIAMVRGAPGGGAGLIGECAVEMPDGESRAPLIEHAVCSVLWE
mgnify:CR=1 FL=1